MPESLFVVTNRAFRRVRGGAGYELRDGLNPKGSRELRLFEARPRGGDVSDWVLEPARDRPTLRDFESHGVEPLRRKRRYNGSDLVAARLVDTLRTHRRNLLVFIHGYNTNALDAIRRAWRIAERYDIEVLLFTWPANGGGERLLENLHGVASYKSDKSDARASTEALDRMLGRMHMLMQELNTGVWEQAEADARAAHPDSPERRREALVRALRERACPFNISLLAHSMGNYLYKKMLLSSGERLSADTVFDNVILKAADTNHEGHAQWVERIRARRRVYVTINQEDDALRLSTMKIGDQQRARLGNTLARQDAANARYIDLTSYVGDAHSYFDEADLERAPGGAKPLTDFVARAVNGESAEDGLDYQVATNTYRLG